MDKEKREKREEGREEGGGMERGGRGREGGVGKKGEEGGREEGGRREGGGRKRREKGGSAEARLESGAQLSGQQEIGDSPFLTDRRLNTSRYPVVFIVTMSILDRRWCLRSFGASLDD